ncbi:MAG: tRNA pseudouridine(55) synthase TruB [Alphaproteobacteria bacterium]|jgi:tRNA pseudouridine55 synthase|nr:tRNA pseudouridine(55) synthase TruB [Alphaproteobacteria bacterium]
MTRSSTTLSGWINLDKPYGMSSTQASTIVRRLTGAAKAGHAGTLDPLATGVLPIALGEATKTIPYAVADVKQYSFQVTWGEQRITDDAEGTVIATAKERPSAESITGILPQFIGIIPQQPPLFSAIKIEGQRAYDLARAGGITSSLDDLKKAIALKTRPVTIHNLVLESIDSPDHATFTVTCGPGTYVRSLARDMAKVLHTVGYISRLRRIRVGKFHQNDAISLETLREFGHKSELYRKILPLGAVLDDIPAVPLTVEEAVMIRQGQRIPVTGKQAHSFLVVLKLADQIIALAQERDGYFYPKRVFK